jgi:hypothetical protein
MKQLTSRYGVWTLPIHSPLCVLLVGLMMVSGCGKKKKAHDAPPTPPKSQPLVEVVDKEWLVQKSINTLRLGEALPAGQSVGELATLDSRDAALKLMNDDAFYNMLTDFTMYWIGTRQPSVRGPLSAYGYKTDGTPLTGIQPEVARSLAALNSVRTLASGGDYFSGLFSEKGKGFVTDIQAPSLYVAGTTTPSADRETIRANIIDQLKLLEADIRPYASVEGKTQFCEKLKAVSDRVSFSFGRVSVPSNIFDDDRSSDDKISDLGDWCSDESTSINPAETLNDLMRLAAEEAATMSHVDKVYGGKHPLAVQHVTDLIPIDWATNGRGPQFDLWDQNLFIKVPNSSTNRNRKRAGWVLKRFLCDDLTPINVEAPAAHSGEVHGSNPACYSCHYKLDPMAGYFRELGFRGASFANQPDIFFDDGATALRSTYEQPWKAPEGAGREWNIGYIRSTVDTSQNTYGSNFSDLMAMLKTAPEVKECFVKRVFEYVVGENQTYDRTWGREILGRMNETAKVSPVLALKGVFADMATSRAFSARKRDNNLCYDLPAGATEAERAPCRIAAIIEKNCVSCHSATNKQGGLNLASWQRLANGDFGFSQIKNGQEVAPSVLFKSMFDRLGSADPALRMPLMKTMLDPERQELYLWLDKNSQIKK